MYIFETHNIEINWRVYDKQHFRIILFYIK